MEAESTTDFEDASSLDSPAVGTNRTTASSISSRLSSSKSTTNNSVLSQSLLSSVPLSYPYDFFNKNTGLGPKDPTQAQVSAGIFVFYGSTSAIARSIVAAVVRSFFLTCASSSNKQTKVRLTPTHSWRSRSGGWTRSATASGARPGTSSSRRCPRQPEREQQRPPRPHALRSSRSLIGSHFPFSARVYNRFSSFSRLSRIFQALWQYRKNRPANGTVDA